MLLHHALKTSLLIAATATTAFAQNTTRRPASGSTSKSVPTTSAGKPAAPKPTTAKPVTTKPETSAGKTGGTGTPSKPAEVAPEPAARAATMSPTTLDRATVALTYDSTAKTAKTLMISVNPLGLLYGGLTGEAEKRLSAKYTVAAAINYWGAYGANYTSMDLKYRIYQNPSNEFRGLSYGPMIGFQRVGVVLCDVEFGEACSTTGLTLGGTVDYVLLFGKEERWTAAFGAGVKTSIGMEQLSGVTFTYPFIRVGIGYAFPKK